MVYVLNPRSQRAALNGPEAYARQSPHVLAFLSFMGQMVRDDVLAARAFRYSSAYAASSSGVHWSPPVQLPGFGPHPYATCARAWLRTRSSV